MDTVPETFEPLIPVKPSAIYKYENEGAASLPGTMCAHQVMAAIKSKCSADEVIAVMKDLPNPLKEEDGE